MKCDDHWLYVTNVDLYMYADDAKIMIPIQKYEDREILQNSLNNILNWSIQWGLKFNPNKCKAVSFSKKWNVILFDYTVQDSLIEQVQSITELGLLVDSKLN